MKAAHSKPLIWVIMILQALPIPLSLITLLGSLISLANIGMTAEQYGPWVTVCAVAAMLLAGTYVVPYVVATVVTTVRKRLG